MEKSEKTAFVAIISGMVQGVGFRYFAYREALALGVEGYVKNLINGNVEVFAEGPRDQLERLIEILNQGPRFGEVDKVEVEWHDYKGRYDTFFIETGY